MNNETELTREDALELAFDLVGSAADAIEHGDKKKAASFLDAATSAMALADRFPGGVLVSQTVIVPAGPIH